jgi:LPXTG-motif cell wall-anchored protein
MKISTAGIKLIACGALVAVGLTVGSGSAHAAPVLIEPTADQCKSYAQYAVDEGEGETLAEELLEHGLNPAGCPAGTVLPSATPCVEGHRVVNGVTEHCYTEGYSNPKDRPAGYPIPPAVPGCDTSKLDGDGDYDCTPFPVPAPKPAAGAVGDSSNAPVVVQGVTVSNAPPAVAAAVTPAKAATLSTPVLAAAATPAATTAKALPLTGGDITGLVLVAFGALGIGGALVLVDKRRRTA